MYVCIFNGCNNPLASSCDNADIDIGVEGRSQSSSFESDSYEITYDDLDITPDTSDTSSIDSYHSSENELDEPYPSGDDINPEMFSVASGMSYITSQLQLLFLFTQNSPLLCLLFRMLN